MIIAFPPRVSVCVFVFDKLPRKQLHQELVRQFLGVRGLCRLGQGCWTLANIIGVSWQMRG